MLSDVLVLCTRNRPTEVRTCLDTVRTQTRLPGRVLVVDSSDGTETEQLVRELAATWPDGSVIAHLRAEPGLTRQRAAGIDATADDIVHFVDDDTVLDPGYFAAIVAAFEADPDGRVGGVGGFVTDQPEHRFRRVDALLGLDGAAEGVVLPSGRNVRVYTEPREPLDVDWLSGCAMSYRRAVFASERPNLKLGRDRNGEDVELSYRVRQRWRLVVTPDARIEHHESPRGRRSREQLVRVELISRYERVQAGTGRLSRRAFWVSALGQLVWYGAKGLATFSGERLAIARETAAGIVAIVRARTGPATAR
ncbi:MAG TPA: glycosyltransferase [Acidimicrobiia bacterium]